MSKNEGSPLRAADRVEFQPVVLLVEDDRSVRRYLEVILQRLGYKVIAASDGLEGMKLAMTSAIDVIVTDAVMPHMSGQELARFVRSNAKLAKLPIILLTGQENKAAAGTNENLIDAFIYKPVKVDELQDCLAKLIVSGSECGHLRLS